MFKRASEYAATVWRAYKAHVAGWLLAIVAIGLNIAAAFFIDDPSKSAVVVRWSATLTGAGAIWLMLVAQYDVWRKERLRAETAEMRLVPRMRIDHPQQHFWGLEERRGSSGMGYYFQVFNLSDADSLESVSARLVSIEPDEVKILPLPLHIRHKDWRTVETSISPGSSEGFDIATGPDHDVTAQGMVIPCIINGDRGIVNVARIPNTRYHIRIRVTAKNCPPQDLDLELWVENNFLRCVPRQIFAMGAP